MQKILALLLLVITVESLGQLKSNQPKRITKKEFEELWEHRSQFVPIDLGRDTIIIIRYTGERLEQLQRRALNAEYGKYDPDTVAFEAASQSTKRQKEGVRKFAAEYPEELKEGLRKKGIEGIVVDEHTLASETRYRTNYWLKTGYNSKQNSPTNNGWVMTQVILFYDPKENRNFEILLTWNYTLFDLMEGKNVKR